MTLYRLFVLLLLPLILPHPLAAEDVIGHWELSPEARGASQTSYQTDISLATFNSYDSIYANQGRSLVDIEIRYDGSSERFDAVWKPVSGTIHKLIQGSSSDWTNFFNSMGPLNGRFLDVEVDYYNGVKKYSSIFLEDGDDYAYALRTTNDEATFQTRLDENFRAGLQIIDFEVYTVPNSGVNTFAGVWVEDPNQPKTHLYYHLQSAELSDLLDPLHGRVIDFERYYSELHDEIRYAVIIALVPPSGGWALYRGMTSSGLISNNTSIADSNTGIVDIESWNIGGTNYYGAVWGGERTSMYEVPSVPSDSNPIALPSTLSTLASNFESGNQGTIGFFAKNLRTNESFGYRADEMFYIASCTKVAIHIRLWQLLQAGHLNLTDTIEFTENANTPEPWFFEDRCFPGTNSGGQCNSSCTSQNSDWGQDLALSRLDNAMMQVSDNAATSIFIDHPDIGLMEDSFDFNEWFAGVDGVAGGFGVITSIANLDRIILWQGQVVNFPTASSFFLCPPWRFEPWSRGCGDLQGNLASFFGGSIPATNGNDGYERYYSMGLNSAEPRAFVTLQEKFWEGEFLDEQNTRAALQVMTEWTPLDDNGLPSEVTLYTKGGAKGGASNPLSYTAIAEIGPDAVGMAFFTKDNQRTGTQVRTFAADFGEEVINTLFSDLSPTGYSGNGPAAGVYSPTTQNAGGEINFLLAIENNGGVASRPVRIDFFASTNTTISTADTFLGSYTVPAINPGASTFIAQPLMIPTDLNPRSYYLGYIIDANHDDDNYGELGEFDEDNNVSYFNTQLTVEEPEVDVWVVE